MLKLPDVTLFAIDCVQPRRTLEAMEFSTRFVRFAEVMLLTDLSKHNPDLPKVIGHHVPYTLIHHEETDRKAPRLLAPYHAPLPLDYELAVLREPSQHVRTSHLIHMEWDSAVLNPEAWDPRWLEYDYMGAPWSPHHEPGWPPCDGETNAVGNGGFSLKSLRYAEATRSATTLFKGDPGMISSDMWSCRTIRPWLEKQGIKFAPPEVAGRFSCENRIYSGQFAYHGKHTAEMNGWQGPFSKVRP